MLGFAWFDRLMANGLTLLNPTYEAGDRPLFHSAFARKNCRKAPTQIGVLHVIHALYNIGDRTNMRCSTLRIRLC